ncbi:MAG: hypothetical protein K2X93_27630 [Candidatus Obscuribacterales bacterium]|nr:hypothetical protein [Candidatus Obscuribacterales bacterium]
MNLRIASALTASIVHTILTAQSVLAPAIAGMIRQFCAAMTKLSTGSQIEMSGSFACDETIVLGEPELFAFEQAPGWLSQEP